MPRKATATAYTQYFHQGGDAMVLRSGKSINGIKNSTLYKDANILLEGNNDIDTPQFGYCVTCFRMFTLFDFLEKHHKELRGEGKARVYGTTLLKFYTVVRDKLQEFIDSIDSNRYKPCECDAQDYRFNGALYDNICRMSEMSEREEYSEMANYTGYGRDREKYRIYHLNFFVVEHLNLFVEEDRNPNEYYLTRDFQKAKQELLHWLKYFQQRHQTEIDTIEAAKKELDKYFPRDCVGEIIKFI